MEDYWTSVQRHPNDHARKFQYPNEYNPTPLKIEHGSQHNAHSSKHNSVSNFLFANGYHAIESNIHQQIPDMRPYNRPASNQHNPVPAFEYPNQYNPTYSSVPHTNQFKPDSNYYNPVPKFQYPNEYNPTQLAPTVPNIDLSVWATRGPKMRRHRPYRTRQQRRTFRLRRPSRIRRPRPCQPSIWGYYYGHYGMSKLSAHHYDKK